MTSKFYGTNISVLRDKSAAVASYLKNLHPDAEWSSVDLCEEIVEFHCSHRTSDIIRALLWNIDFAADSLLKREEYRLLRPLYRKAKNAS
tara:strand:+ start:213 stop:482 length:270 start_codon:yes stop_codon:yes gene_type:complete